MEQRNVLITGSSQGLGAVIAESFAAAGATVFVNCAHDQSNADEVVRKITTAGGRAEIFLCDISDEKQINTSFAALTKMYGAIDILINNARIDPYSRTESCSDGEWFDHTMAVNLKGAYLMSLVAMEEMKKRRWGRIVNISSVWAYWPASPRMMAYSMSKAGLHAMTRALALDGAPFGITANTIAPGLIITENLANRLTSEQLRAEMANIPLRRGATPEEIAQVVLHTVTDGFITGETINVNGGAYMSN